jgi:hypothetical protein
LRLFSQFQVRHGLDHRQCAARRPFGIVFMCTRIPEVDQNPIAHISRDETVEAVHDFGDSIMIGAD